MMSPRVRLFLFLCAASGMAACTLEIVDADPPGAGPSCGDGVLDADEACDDGNTVGGDGCSADCLSEEGCGNGVLDAGEVCDDGNHASGDGCAPLCDSTEVCGNLILDPLIGEVCDDGNTVGGDGCSADCHAAGGGGCGNGIIDAGE